jgi:SAM-dependent methyltransferase
MNKINYYSIYEKEYQFEDDCEFLSKELSSGNTLEIGCGTGRILSYLKKKRKDLKLYAIDIDKKAIKIAKEKTKIKNIFCRKGEKFISKERFNNIFCMFNTFMYFNNHQKKEILEKVKINLKKNGIFYLSVFNPSKERINEKYPFYKFQKSISLNKTKIEKFEYNIYNKQTQTIDRVFNYDYISNNNILKRVQYKFKQYYLFREQLISIIKREKFKILSIYGNFKKKKFNINSPYIILKVKINIKNAS